MGLKKMKSNKGYISDLEKGMGSLKNYKYYFIGGRPLQSKAVVIEAINLGVRLFRKDKIMNTIEEFNYENLKFEKRKICN